MLRERFQKWLTVNFPTRMQELPFLSFLPQEAQVVKPWHLTGSGCA
jgi:hypothetical protein